MVPRMKTLIQAKNMKPTRALRRFIDEQVNKVQRLGVPIARLRVFLENITRKDSDPHRASVQMEANIPGKGKVTVKSQAHDLYLAVNEAVRSLMRHVRKEKEKRISISRRKRHRGKLW
ncbi:MAG: hypothetical protein UX28_C0003G0088 [Candidatus Pacebacteria bacterium GW2011_GWA1_46_10]|nr:MAG: hypothetical protein UX28_C0003G0088 [Candidatus Pacebacteria bacterium GW2011_GWA1_46_10]HCR81285.1 ribosome-associated translation inhibitor RaiA [Candidatus Paceibacterota bacterium]